MLPRIFGEIRKFLKNSGFFVKINQIALDRLTIEGYIRSIKAHQWLYPVGK